MKTEFIITEFAQKPCIAISFKEPDHAAFTAPLFFLEEKPDLNQKELSDYMSSHLNQPIFKEMLALIAFEAEDYANNANNLFETP